MAYVMIPAYLAQLIPDQAKDVLLGGAILLAIVLVVFVALIVLLKKMDPRRASSRPDHLGPGLSLDELEGMHDAGSISDEEYRIMRQIVIGKEYARATRLPAKGSAPDIAAGSPSEDAESSESRDDRPE